MLKLKSKVMIGDNSGATKAEVIKILRPKNGKTGVLGSLLLVAIKRNIPNSKIRKGTMSKAYYIRTNRKNKSYSNSLK
jgi:large subunit ribosomal protein L14